MTETSSAEPQMVQVNGYKTVIGLSNFEASLKEEPYVHVISLSKLLNSLSFLLDAYKRADPLQTSANNRIRTSGILLIAGTLKEITLKVEDLNQSFKDREIFQPIMVLRAATRAEKGQRRGTKELWADIDPFLSHARNSVGFHGDPFAKKTFDMLKDVTDLSGDRQLSLERNDTGRLIDLHYETADILALLSVLRNDKTGADWIPSVECINRFIQRHLPNTPFYTEPDELRELEKRMHRAIHATMIFAIAVQKVMRRFVFEFHREIGGELTLKPRNKYDNLAYGPRVSILTAELLPLLDGRKLHIDSARHMVGISIEEGVELIAGLVVDGSTGLVRWGLIGSKSETRVGGDIPFPLSHVLEEDMMKFIQTIETLIATIGSFRK